MTGRRGLLIAVEELVPGGDLTSVVLEANPLDQMTGA